MREVEKKNEKKGQEDLSGDIEGDSRVGAHPDEHPAALTVSFLYLAANGIVLNSCTRLVNQFGFPSSHACIHIYTTCFYGSLFSINYCSALYLSGFFFFQFKIGDQNYSNFIILNTQSSLFPTSHKEMRRHRLAVKRFRHFFAGPAASSLFVCLFQ